MPRTGKLFISDPFKATYFDLYFQKPTLNGREKTLTGDHKISPIPYYSGGPEDRWTTTLSSCHKGPGGLMIPME